MMIDLVNGELSIVDRIIDHSPLTIDELSQHLLYICHLPEVINIMLYQSI